MGLKFGQKLGDAYSSSRLSWRAHSRFCYHEEPVGMCRMRLVMSTLAEDHAAALLHGAEGMSVDTQSEAQKSARRHS